MGPPSTSHFMVLADTPSGLSKVDPPRPHQPSIAKPINAVQPLQPHQQSQSVTTAAVSSLPASAPPPASTAAVSTGQFYLNIFIYISTSDLCVQLLM